MPKLTVQIPSTDMVLFQYECLSNRATSIKLCFRRGLFFSLCSVLPALIPPQQKDASTQLTSMSLGLLAVLAFVLIVAVVPFVLLYRARITKGMGVALEPQLNELDLVRVCNEDRYQPPPAAQSVGQEDPTSQGSIHKQHDEKDGSCVADNTDVSASEDDFAYEYVGAVQQRPSATPEGDFVYEAGGEVADIAEADYAYVTASLPPDATQQSPKPQATESDSHDVQTAEENTYVNVKPGNSSPKVGNDGIYVNMA
eukprot:scpid80592/ scgid23396/ 